MLWLQYLWQHLKAFARSVRDWLNDSKKED
jgi:hypothetical protein